jgi:ubiquinone/menaquinone biosynthesis C-methylase UbiE
MFQRSSKFTVIDGIYSFINYASISGDNLKSVKLYDKIAPYYNISQQIYFILKFGSERKFREQFLNELDIKDTDRVLETSAGTGDNFRFLNRKAEYTGVDISLKMLRKARKNTKRWNLVSTLIHCEAENLPFADNTFDVTFHCGGMNYYNDRRKAIQEMIRVSKPGTKILIVDETDKLVKESYQKNPALKGHFEDADKADAPVDLIPEGMLDIKSEIVCNGTIYKLTFVKPL